MRHGLLNAGVGTLERLAGRQRDSERLGSEAPRASARR